MDAVSPGQRVRYPYGEKYWRERGQDRRVVGTVTTGYGTSALVKWDNPDDEQAFGQMVNRNYLEPAENG